MGILRKPYEVSVWEDILQQNGTFKEVKILIIGSNTMTSQSRILSPKLVTNINGTNTFTFDLYYRYKDNITGTIIENPFTPYITNERKIKLKYDNIWYDFLIKSIKIDTTKYMFSVTATDQYINELSKNGFNISYSAEEGNNVGTVTELTNNLLENTDWTVSNASEFVPNISKETLISLTFESGEDSATVLYANKLYHIDDSQSGVAPVISNSYVSWPDPQAYNYYGFYSCCEEQSSRFSLICIPGNLSLEDIEKDDERVILHKNWQYFIDGLTSSDYSNSNSLYATYGIRIPNGFKFNGISADFRGAKYSFTPKMQYNSILETYATIYEKNNTEYLGITDTEYKAPNLIKNIVTNPNTFQSTSGWTLLKHFSNSDFDTQQHTDNFNTYTKLGTLTQECVRISGSTYFTIIDDLKANRDIHNSSFTYTSKLHYQAPTDNDRTTLCNSGFYDNRSSIESLKNGQRYVVKISGKLDTLFNNSHPAYLRIGSFEVRDGNKINLTDNQHKKIYMQATFDDNWGTTTSNGKTYRWRTLTVSNADNFTPKSFKEQNANITIGNVSFSNRIYITIAPFHGDFYIDDFQIFPEVKDEQENLIEPDGSLINGNPNSESTWTVKGTNTTYYELYNKNTLNNVLTDPTITKDDVNPDYHSTIKPTDAGYTLPLSCEKRRAITIKESNYFNIIQTICETFECWAKFIVNHRADGSISSKQVEFHNYVGQENFAGFRYGVNLKSITRTDDSKQIVTKLIVKQNSNTNAKHGFCTIARAPSNETGENYIYNMDYYISQGLLSASDWICYIYGTDTPGTLTGYYPKLKAKNDKININNDCLLSLYNVLAQASSDLTVYANAKTSADYNFELAAEAFRQFFGFEWDDHARIYALNRDSEQSKKLSENIEYLTKCVALNQAVNDYTTKYNNALAETTKLKKAYKNTETKNQQLIEEKADLNKSFYNAFYRYIQEGTWISEDYYDDELYYLDALSTLYNSSVPKVTYALSVLELSQLSGYEGYTFKLGDRTFVEDIEYFGYDDQNNPIQEQVVLTEITYNFDEPEKNIIKVQNYKNQFQDLFKRITATVQSVQFASGAYEKAAQLANATDQIKSAFLQDALNDAGLILQNLAEQTVRLDSEGLTIIDGLEQNKMLRAVSKGILLTTDGGNTWKTGITVDGICASILTSGTLNTGEVNILYGKEPTFRWDRYGITAYKFDINGGDTASNFDRRSGVRFDRFGIYGFSLGNIALDSTKIQWTPNAIVEWTVNDGTYAVKADDSNHSYIRNKSIFELTREGLYLNLGTVQQKHRRLKNGNTWSYGEIDTSHNGTAILGRVDDLVYNAWSQEHIPYYDTSDNNPNHEFIQIMRVSKNELTNSHNSNHNGTFGIFDDGTIIAKQLYISKEIGYTAAFDNSDDGKLNGSQTVYYYSNSTIMPNNVPDYWITNTSTVLSTWFRSTAAPSATSGKLYIYKATQTKLGKTRENNGNTEILVDNSEVTLYRALPPDDSGLSQDAYAMLLNFTSFHMPDGFYYKIENNKAHLYINASFINTGTLTVSKEIGGQTRIIFSAGWDDSNNPIVQIAGFTVEPGRLYCNTIGNIDGILLTTQNQDNSIVINSKTKSDWRFIVGSKFGVDKEGNIYASGGEIGGCGFYNGILQLPAAQLTGAITGRDNDWSLDFDRGILTINHIDASSITSGTLDVDRINGLPVSKLTSGTCNASDIVYSKGINLGDDGYFKLTPESNGFRIGYSTSDFNTDCFLRLGYGDFGFATLFGYRTVTINTMDMAYSQITMESRNITIGINDAGSGTQTNGYLCGNWSLNGSTIATTSDRNKKNTIHPLINDYSTFFDNLLPVTFKYNNGTSNRLHIGFVAQDVKQALDQANISTQDFGGYVKFEENEQDTYGLRYEEFIALNTWQIQKLKARIQELENRITSLENLLSN